MLTLGYIGRKRLKAIRSLKDRAVAYFKGKEKRAHKSKKKGPSVREKIRGHEYRSVPLPTYPKPKGKGSTPGNYPKATPLPRYPKRKR